MPPRKAPSRTATISLPSREAIDAGETDVLVVGGGPAGLGAALGAAAAGARVVLAEHHGFLGGNATAALVMPFSSYHTESSQEDEVHPPPLLGPRDHGRGQAVIGGAVASLVECLVAAGGAIPPSRDTGYVVPFDPEVFKLVALDLLDQRGVEFLLHVLAVGVLGREHIRGVIFETKSGPVVIRAKVVVDCTGDGDVAARSGAPYEIGREADGLVQPMTLMFVMAGFHRTAFAAYVREHPSEWRGVYGLWDLVRRAREAGELDLPREDILFFATTREEEVVLNCTRIVRVRGVDVWDLTYAEWVGRMQMREIAAFLRKYAPGFEVAHIAQSGFVVGARETRRIRGEYVLTSDDILTARKFADVVAHGTYPIDIHNPAGSGTVLKRVPPGDFYDIPLRCLIPLGVDNLLVAGRCISGTHEALSSYRVMPISMATGQAAGVCAALSARSVLPPGQIDPVDVRAELRRQGAILRH
jgi:glycine/D-amino acid oxidase-like deaminating enzyme